MLLDCIESEFGEGITRSKSYNGFLARVIFAHIAHKHINMIQKEIAAYIGRCRSDVAHMLTYVTKMDDDGILAHSIRHIEREYLKRVR